MTLAEQLWPQLWSGLSVISRRHHRDVPRSKPSQPLANLPWAIWLHAIVSRAFLPDALQKADRCFVARGGARRPVGVLRKP